MRPVVAGDGEAAWDRLLEATPAVLVTDHQMPRLSGLSLIERVRGDARFADLPILFCSAKGLELDLDYLKDALRVRQVFFKPFSPRSLVQAIEEAIQEPTVN
jgi:CheY-like chemotaxis protein